jgi:hypothetical protein
MHLRLCRRTEAVRSADWDVKELRHVAAELARAEDGDLLFRAVRTCVFAGYVDDGWTRVGCMIHPRQHPDGTDLRDLGAYADKEICAGHLCGPHQWLAVADRALLQAAPSWNAYSMAVGESGFLKAALRWVAARRGAEVQAEALMTPEGQRAAASLLALFDAWPFADPNPRRFGGFSFAGDEAYQRAPSAARFPGVVTSVEALMLDALGTLVDDEIQARRAVEALRECLSGLVSALS